MKRLLLLAFSAAAVLSCARSEIQPAGGNEQFSLTVEQLPFESVNPATRAIENSSNTTVFQNGDAIGVYVHTSVVVGTTGNHSSNMRYVTSDKGATWKAANSLGGELLSGTTYKATAYYPFQAGLLNPTSVAHTVDVDQSDTNTSTETAAGALESSDFMVASAVAITGVPAAPKSTLIFAHAMCKLVVKVGVPTIIDGATVSKIKSITINGTKIAATVNISTNPATVTASGSATTITPRLKSGDGTAGKIAEYEAIVVPQTVAANTLLVDIVCTTNVGEKPLKYIVPTGQSLSLTQGKKVTLTLSSSADLAFTSELDLMSGLAATNLPLKIKVPNATAWALQSSKEWLTLSTSSGGTYFEKITGTGTGADQTVYVKVDANNAATTPREAILTLSTSTGSIIYGALQNYYKFDVKATTVDITKDGTAVALPEAITNQVWNLALVEASLPSWAKISAKVSNAAPTWSNAVQVTLPHNVIGSLNAATLYVVAEKTTDKSERSFKIKYGSTVITITQEQDGDPINPPATTDYIKIGNLLWAKGNLIAASKTYNGGVKIGAPTDGGLYFQFGSLIGYKGGKTSNGGTGVGIPDGSMSVVDNDGKYWWGDATAFTWTNDAMVWPTAMTTKPSGWPNNYGSSAGDRPTVISQYFFNYNVAPYSTSGQNIAPFAVSFAGDAGSGNLGSARYAVWGIGDPCSYYLGGKWRQATNLEFAALFNNAANGTAHGAASKSYLSSNYTDANSSVVGRGIYANATSAASAPSDPNALFFPASGYRLTSNGSFGGVGRLGYYWSGSVYTATSGFHLHFNSTYVYPQNLNYRSLGFPVRCVSEP